jgi:UPF0755 protein
MDNEQPINNPAPDFVLPAEQEAAPQPEPSPIPNPTADKNMRVKIKLAAAISFLAIVTGIWMYRSFIIPPKQFPVDTVISIREGEVLSGAANSLLETRAIKSRTAFKMSMVFFGGTKGLRAGEYYLEKPETAISLARRLSTADYALKNIRVTIPEGLNVKEIAAIFAKERSFKKFDEKQFIEIATPLEGYLFPETYLFLPNITAGQVVEIMQDTYKKKIESIASELEAFKRPIADVIKMASILEEEGRMPETRRTIAGILWKRLDEKMPLQVDASIVYATGKSDGNKLVTEDFQIKSPYNSYINLGLPPTPISNPGLEAIKAAIDPIRTKYYFYLTDPNGGFHPAITYEQHLVNKEKYLK